MTPENWDLFVRIFGLVVLFAFGLYIGAKK